MATKKNKICKSCGRFVDPEKNECPSCKNNSFVEKYKGRALILDAKHSEIAKTLDVKDNGNYAIKY